MHLPQAFEKELQDAFQGRFRLRWSEKLHEFHLEQRIATGQVLPPPVEDGIYDTYDDSWIRARDGYFFVMSIRHGDRMPCPVCHQDVKVPVMHTGETKCFTCMFHGRDPRIKAAYFPLNNSLLDHIRDIDPMNGGPLKVRQRMRAKQLAKQARDTREGIEEAEGRVMDNKYQVEQRPMVGYGPKTAQRGDESRFV